MKTHKHLFATVCSWDNVLAASREALRGKRRGQAAARFFAEQEKEVVALVEELRTGTYRHGPYHYFTIHEPKERLLGQVNGRERGTCKKWVVAGRARRLVKQQRDQPPRLEPEHERPDEREQQHWFSCRKPLEFPGWPDRAAWKKSAARRARLRDYPRVRRLRSQAGRQKTGGRPR